MPSYTLEQLAQDAFNGRLPKSATDVENYSKYDYRKCVRCGDWPSLAAHIVESFGININVSSLILGGHCPGYDIKLQDAYSMIKLSLAYGLLCGELWECYINEHGEAEFIVVGEPYGDGFAGDLGAVYLSVAAISYALPTERIILTGYKPSQTRRLAGPKTLHQLAAATNRFHSSYDNTATLYKDTGTVFLDVTTGGSMKTTQGWRRVGPIDWENTDALNFLFKVKDYADGGPKPYESISGFAYTAKLPHVCDPESTTIAFQENGPRFNALTAGFTNNNFISWWNVDETNLDGTVTGGTTLPDGVLEMGVDYPGQWLGVENVYVYGYPISEIKIEYKDSVSHNGAYLGQIADSAIVKIDTQKLDMRSLSRGSDYIVIDKGFGPEIVFANYVSDEYNELYTKGLPMKIDNACLIDGKLRDGKIPQEVQDGGDINYAPLSDMVLFPVGKGDRGYAVKFILVVSTHAYPVIAVEDTKGQLAHDYMSEAQIYSYAIIMNDAPAPIVFANSVEVSNAANGGTIVFPPGCRTLDQSDMEPDDDPFGDLEYFWDNEVQVANESMGPGDITLTLPFFEEYDLCTIANNILAIAAEGREPIPGSFGYSGYREVMFTCSPDSHPRLGQKIEYEGRIYYVNDINYSYQDSSQYVVNVTAGAKWVNSVFGGGWSESINYLKVENVTREGRVVGAGSNNAEFIVYIEGFGNLACVNTAGMGTVIVQGDIVKVTIYNVPQGEM